jgi:DASH complex subunit ASK1
VCSHPRQEIDSNFARAYRTITEVILPNVEKYGEASKGILESVQVRREETVPSASFSLSFYLLNKLCVQFWKTFFESSAGIRLTEHPEQEPSTTSAGSPAQEPISPVSTQESSYLTESTASSPSSSSSSSSSPSSTVRGTPASSRRNPQWSNDVPLSDMLQRSLELDITNRPPPEDSNEDAADISKPSFLRRPLDADLDSPELIRPELETMSLDNRLQTTDSKGKGKAKSLSNNKSSKDPRLFRQVLDKHGRRGSSSQTPRVSTPKKINRSQFPSDLPLNWDGLADLSKTPLSSLVSPRRHPRLGAAGISEDSADLTLSPPLIMSVNRARLTKTPGKEAARLITRDVLRSAALRGDKDDWRDVGGDDSPLEPPSVVKNWKARGYGGQFDDRLPPPPSALRGEGARKAFEEEDDAFDPGDAVPDTRFGLVRDDEDEVNGGFGGEGRSFEVEAEEETWEDSYDQSLGDENISFGAEAADLDVEADPLVDFAEDTVFGGRRSTIGAGAGAAGAAARRSTVGGKGGPAGTQPQAARDSNGSLVPPGFQLKGLGADEMHTLHGGDLLQSQPFDRSPLAGRDWRGL